MKLSVLDQSPVPAGYTAVQALRNSVDLAQRAEQLGYTRYWLAEHHATPTFAGPAPEALIPRIADATSTIRVGSGGVLLPHYSPLKVAEVFRVLEALYPGRIDLGLGRGLGGHPLDREGLGAFALQRRRDARQDQQDAADQLVELLAFLHGGFPPEHAFSRIAVTPDTPGAPEVWLLGSTGWSADAAAQLGLPYAAAHFINPKATRESVEHYRRRFQPSPFLDRPRLLLAVTAVCAASEAEAERLYASQRLQRRLSELPSPSEEEAGPLPDPDEALARLDQMGPGGADDEGEWPRAFIGEPKLVHARLAAMAGALGAEELMLVTVIHDHEARVRSYELAARAFALPRPG